MSKKLTLRQMRYFQALARVRHFGKAAEECGVSQPALSLQIRELEQDLGLCLVERGARGIMLTASGRAVLTRCEAILRAVEDMADLGRSAAGHPAGPLRLGALPTIAPYLLPSVITALSVEFPTVRLSLREAQTTQLLEDLRAGRLDAALLALPLGDPAFCEVELFSEDFVLVRPAHAALNPLPRPEQLQDMGLLLLEDGHCFRDQALSFCKIDAADSAGLMAVSTLSTLVQMVGAGIGVTLLPEMAVPVESRAANIVISRFPTGRPARNIGMLWRKTSPLDAQLREIAQMVQRIGLDLPWAQGRDWRPAWSQAGGQHMPIRRPSREKLL